MTDPTQIRRQLKSLGQRRQANKTKASMLQDETAEALRSARGVIPVSEAAKLLGITRSTVYEVYGDR